jgi:hypothetical protein
VGEVKGIGKNTEGRREDSIIKPIIHCLRKGGGGKERMGI